MKNNKMIIVEGPQGTGKTTLANYLRDNLAGSNLYRLSGQKDKTEKGLNYSILMYDALVKYLIMMQSVPMDIIFDRTFMTEEVYARLGYKDYQFTNYYKRYLYEFNNLYYDIYYFSLYLKNVELFRERLARDSHHNYQAFSLENSANQQNMYKDIANELRDYKNISVYELAMDNFNESYDSVKRILNIK